MRCFWKKVWDKEQKLPVPGIPRPLSDLVICYKDSQDLEAVTLMVWFIIVKGYRLESARRKAHGVSFRTNQVQNSFPRYPFQVQLHGHMLLYSPSDV